MGLMEVRTDSWVKIQIQLKFKYLMEGWDNIIVVVAGDKHDASQGAF